jgi:two-component system OmpR family sensor kinase
MKHKKRLQFWPLSVRMQLTLWSVTVFSILLLLLGTIFYMNLRIALSNSFDNTLELRAQQFADSLQKNNNVLNIHDCMGELCDNDSQVPDFDIDFDVFTRIIDAQGKVRFSTPAFLTITTPSQSITQPLHGITWIGTVTTHNGQIVRLYSQPLTDHGKIFGVVQVATSLTQLENTLHSVMLELLLVIPVFLVLGIFGSYWLAARAFQPIKRLTQTARTIKNGDLQSRVPVPQTHDEIQHLALTFNEMIDHVEKTFKHQRSFIADASHELRTPVAAIRSMTEVALAQNEPPHDHTVVLSEVNSQAEQLSYLINHLFTLARADEGSIHFAQEPVRLDLQAISVAAAMEGLAAERGITLEVHAEQPALVIGDEARLIQMMMNLLENALTYTGSGGKITLSIEVIASHICLRVTDTGMGIAPEHIEHIFKRFYRTNKARSRAQGGTGLGLSIVDWIVKMHQGTITVESQLEQGSVFTVTLPAHQPAQ